MNNYETLLNKLLTININQKVKLGLDHCKMIHEELGSPSDHYKIIHVAGTNGKGSVTTKIAAALTAQGFKTGLFTSPHISSFRERIKIDHKFISKMQVEEILQILLDKYPTSTFFEITTLLSFIHFYREKVDYAVIETGLGGRLDATNIVNSKLSIITSINYDHTHILGSTIEEITKEKAGIIKKNVPIIIGPKVPLNIISPIAENLNAPLFQVVGSFNNYEEENNAIATKALEILKIDSMAIEKGLKAKPPCRFEIVNGFKSQIVLDVAHNPDGFNRLFERLQIQFPNKKLVAVIGFSKNKDVRESFKIAQKNCQEIHCIQGKGDRCLPLDDFKHIIQDLVNTESSIIYFNPSITNALEKVLDSDGDTVIVICGSFFIMSEIREILGFNDEKDDEEMNERF